jgi:hypothetical protein
VCIRTEGGRSCEVLALGIRARQEEDDCQHSQLRTALEGTHTKAQAGLWSLSQASRVRGDPCGRAP